MVDTLAHQGAAGRRQDAYLVDVRFESCKIFEPFGKLATSSRNQEIDGQPGRNFSGVIIVKVPIDCERQQTKKHQKNARKRNNLGHFRTISCKSFKSSSKERSCQDTSSACSA